MLVILKDQMQAFELIDPKSFEESMLEHVREYFPKIVEVAGEEKILVFNRRSHERAKEYGFATRHEVYLFIDFMVMLGSGFDADPQLPWAADILQDESIPDPTARIDQLYDTVIRYLDQVVGKDGVFPVGPMRTLIDYPLGQLEQRLAAGLEQGMLDEFKRICPQKYDLVSEDQFRKLITEGVELAGAYGFIRNREVGFLLILMYVFGHCFASDPQYSVLTDVLVDKNLSDGKQKLGRLHEVLRTELTKALD
jgi:hypothetical protein